MPSTASNLSLPFTGLTVIELASVLAGPQVGQFFAELGAQVLKIEAPGGDVTRTWRTPGEAPGTDVTAYFACANWGKQSIVLDLTTATGRAAVHRLATHADVVLASYKPGDATKLGVDYDTLAALNPRLLYGLITGYGAAVPRAGYDAVLQAETGFMHLNAAGPGQEPLKMPVALIDLLAAHQLKEGLLAALYRRTQTGQGAVVHVSLQDSALASLANQASTYLVTGQEPRPMGSGHPSIVPYGTVYEASDGVRLLLAVGTNRQFEHLCAVLERPIWAQEARFASNAARVAHRAELEQLLRERILQLPSSLLLAALERLAVPAGAVRTVGQALAQEAAHSMLLPASPEFPHPGLRTVAFHSSAWPRATHLPPPPHLGAHLQALDASSENEIGTNV
ncbi:CaiB/BaiF CoA transferase family protein [Hymenobacter sp. AT01-02]|uniref:CaiB/BaiF CoA transferase family protein n=1 Tax=Hymenobacter sp. AT01-02 TaxID=1571877 RepID=UPI0005F20F51|nr:CoA transferase [Hymenobacter sp. AT01-02]